MELGTMEDLISSVKCCYTGFWCNEEECHMDSNDDCCVWRFLLTKLRKCDYASKLADTSMIPQPGERLHQAHPQGQITNRWVGKLPPRGGFSTPQGCPSIDKKT